MAASKQHKPLTARGRFRQRHLRRWRQSGQSQAQYCRPQQLSEAAFGWWKGRLSAESSPRVKPKRLRDEIAGKNSPFVELTLGDSSQRGSGSEEFPYEIAQDTDPARAVEMLVLIGELYKVEDRAKREGLDRDQIKALRQKESKPILEVIEKRLVLGGPQVLPKSPIGQAVGYAQGQWEALIRYTDDGILSIDNNLAERVLRMVALGRRNWLFVGHDNGGHRAAILYSLVASCKLCGIDPFACFRDVLERISTHPASRVAELLPRNWKPSGS